MILLKTVWGTNNQTVSGCGGMADAQDSKSCVGDYVWVQVPSSALKRTDYYSSCNSVLFFDMYNLAR